MIVCELDGQYSIPGSGRFSSTTELIIQWVPPVEGGLGQTELRTHVRLVLALIIDIFKKIF